MPATGGGPGTPQILSPPHPASDTTGGDLSDASILSSPLSSAPAFHGPAGPPITYDASGPSSDPSLLPSALSILSAAGDVDLTWPAFAALRGAARATKPARFRLALSALVSEARLVFGSCFFLARNSPPASVSLVTKPGADLHRWICTLLAHGAAVLPVAWHWSPEQCSMLLSHLVSLVAPAPPVFSPSSGAPFPSDAVSAAAPLRPYPAALCAFLHSVRVGLPWAVALLPLLTFPLAASPRMDAFSARLFPIRTTDFRTPAFLCATHLTRTPSPYIFRAGSLWQSALRTPSCRDHARPHLLVCARSLLAPRPVSYQTTSA